MRLFQHKHSDNRGAAAVEFALLLPILIVVFGGIIDFGFGFNAQVGLTHAAREGVRAEAIESGTGAATADDAFVPLAVDPNPAQVTRSCPDPDGAEITITADYSPFFVGILPMPDPLTLTGQAVMRCGG